jgi:hypothetical protein
VLSSVSMVLQTGFKHSVGQAERFRHGVWVIRMLGSRIIAD